MPDRRKHRGPHPEDDRLFGRPTWPVLRRAAGDLGWLLSRGYPANSALKLVGDRYGLVARQRMAVGRCVCSDEEVARRAMRMENARNIKSYLKGELTKVVPELGTVSPDGF